MQYFRFLLILGGVAATANAAQCEIDYLAAYAHLGGDSADKRVHVTADFLQGDYQRADFSGAVNLQQGDKHLLAPNLVYRHELGKAELNHGGIFATPRMVIGGITGRYDSDSETATFEKAQYLVAGKRQNAVGEAGRAVFNGRTREDRFENISWTTCGRRNPPWHLAAKSLTLDHQTERATVRDATLNIGSVPIFYLPYFTFPLSNTRQSGFLVPSASTSEERGLELTIPYYWNIAPNQDATLTLQPMSKRGLMLSGEYRYLDAKQYGEFFGSLLPYDWRTGEARRWSVRAQHHYQFNPRWQSDIRFQSMSDEHFAQNFQTDFATYDDWFIQRHATLHGQLSPHSSVMLRFEDYLRLDDSVPKEQTPFARLPQLTYQYEMNNKHFHYQLDSEAVRFHKKHGGNATRVSAEALVSYRLGAPFGYVEPALSINAAHYNLHGWADANPTRPHALNRVVPTFSLDNKLTWEKSLFWQGEKWMQTLEPRLFYLYTPYKNQDDIPVFDTDELSFSWSSLFARNRFSGEDRIADANQLTTALTTSLYRQKDGTEKMRFSLGQVHYFQPQRVHLPTQPANDKARSMIVTEGLLNIDRHWQLSGLTFWNNQDFHRERAILNLEYNLDADRFVRLSHHLHAKQQDDQYSLAGVWRLNPTWRTFFREDYSARYQQSFNTVIGVEYNSCCWAWRLAGKRFRDSPNGDIEHNQLYLEFVLKGLGNMGSRSGQMLGKEINGFQPLEQEKTF